MEKYRRIAAFTLLELLVVLLIVSLMSAMVLPRLAGSLDRLNSESVAKKIAAALRYARSQAVSERRTFSARFDFEKREMGIRNLKSGNGNSKSEPTYRLPKGVQFAEAAPEERMEAGVFEIVFYPGGNSSGGEVTVLDEKKRQYEISVDFITGSVRLGD